MNVDIFYHLSTAYFSVKTVKIWIVLALHKKANCSEMSEFFKQFLSSVYLSSVKPKSVFKNSWFNKKFKVETIVFLLYRRYWALSIYSKKCGQKHQTKLVSAFYFYYKTWSYLRRFRKKRFFKNKQHIWLLINQSYCLQLGWLGN